MCCKGTDYVEKSYVKLLTVTSVTAVECILPLLFDSPLYNGSQIYFSDLHFPIVRRIRSSSNAATVISKYKWRMNLPHYLTLRLLMSYIYIYIYIYMERIFLMFLDHTQ